jgi:hypothetical protein
MFASLVLGAIGAGLGSLVGMPGIGFSLGAALGSSSLHSARGISQFGPRLDSLQVQSSQYGTPIPLHYGRNRLAGQVIWATDIKEHVKTQRLHAQSGQHHPHVTTYSYSVSFAILLCKGPISSFGRIWLDGKLYLDVREQVFESLGTSVLQKDDITFYPGDEEQLSDPTMQAYLGADNVPAYRGNCYIVFKDLAIDNYGRRIPQVTVELFTDGELEEGKVYPPSVLPAGLENSHFTCLKDNLLRLYNRNNKTVQLLNLNAEPISTTNRQLSIDGDNYNQTLGCLNGKLLRFWGNALYPLRRYCGKQNVPRMQHYPVPTIIGLSEGVADQDLSHIPARAVSIHYLLDVIGDKTQTLLGFAISADQQKALVLLGYGTPYYNETCQPHEWVRLALDNQGAHVEAKGSAQGFDIGLSPYAGISHRTGLPNTHPNVACCLESNGQYLWIAKNSGEKHVLCFEVKESGLTLVYQSRCHVDEQSTLSILADGGFCWVTDGEQVEKFARVTITTPKDPLLADVIVSLCQQAGLAKEQIDVSAVKHAKLLLTGYTVNQSSNVRNSLQTLLTAYQLTAVESNGKLKFMPKSSKPVTIIPYDKLLILDSGANRGSSFSLHNKPSTELPQRLSINYADSASNYQASTQSATKSTTYSQHSQGIEIPLVLESSQAQQLADSLLRDIWQSNETYQFALGIEYLFLEPGDIVTLQTDVATYTLTITQLEVSNRQVHVQGVKAEASENQP